MNRRLLCIVLLAGLFCASSSALGGKRIVVPDPKGVYPLTIQEGIDRASDGDTVLVSDGVYREHIEFQGKLIVVTSWAILDGEERHIGQTIIEGTGISERGAVVTFRSGENVNAVLYGFTIIRGAGSTALVTIPPYGVMPAVLGGGICMLDAGATIKKNVIRDCAVSGPVAGGAGIAIVSVKRHRTVVIEDNIIENNTVNAGWQGGGAGVFGSTTMVLLSGNTIRGNTVVSRGLAMGGGLLLLNDFHTWGTVAVERNILRENVVRGDSAGWGGGAHLYGQNARFVKNTVANNRSESWFSNGGAGGLLVNSDGLFTGEATVEENEFVGNVARTGYARPVFGGGIVLALMRVGFHRNIVRDNIVASLANSSGAGMYVEKTLPGTMICENRFTGNRQELDNTCLGSLRVFGAPDLRITRNVFTGNSVYAGGGMSLRRSSFLVDNNILYGNSAQYGGGIHVSGSPLKTAALEGAGELSGLATSTRGVPGEGVLSPTADAQVIANNTLMGNEGIFGCGVFTEQAEIVVFNTILWNNPVGSVNPLEICTWTGLVNVQYSAVRGGWEGTGNISDYPWLRYDANRLGELLDKSPCIGRGAPLIVVAGVAYEAPTCDCHGHCRPQPVKSNPDIGAEESRLAWASVEVVKEPSPTSVLRQNYPNPFNPMTVISYSVADPGQVTVKVYDLLGREVATLVDEAKEPGSYEVRWDASSVASGMYVYKMTAGAFTETKRLVVVR